MRWERQGSGPILLSGPGLSHRIVPCLCARIMCCYTAKTVYYIPRDPIIAYSGEIESGGGER